MTLRIMKVTAVPVPDAQGKYPPSSMFLVNKSNQARLEIHITSESGDAIKEIVNTGDVQAYVNQLAESIGLNLNDNYLKVAAGRVTDITGMNLNTVINTGFYYGFFMSNAPQDSNSAFFVTTTSVGTTSTNVVQVAVYQGEGVLEDNALAPNGSMFVRNGTNVTSGSPVWSPWERLATNTDVDRLQTEIDQLANSGAGAFVTVTTNQMATPDKFPVGKVYGFDAYLASDMPTEGFYIGIGSGYLNGTALGTERGFQMAQYWNTGLGKATGTYIRVKDTDQESWGEWTKILTEADMVNFIQVQPDGVSLDISFTDLNDAVKTGFFKGTELANAPETGNFAWWVMVESLQSDATPYAVQIATKVATGQRYQRLVLNGVWGSWTMLPGKDWVDSVNAQLTSLSDQITTGNTDLASMVSANYLTTPDGRNVLLAAGTDLNALQKTGFYQGTGLVNAPNGATGEWFITNQQHPSTNKRCQIAIAAGVANAGSEAGDVWVRTATSMYTWSAWRKQLTSVAPFAVLENNAGTTAAVLLPDNTDVDTLKNTGMYRGDKLLNVPVTNPDVPAVQTGNWWIEVIGDDTNFTYQRAISYGGTASNRIGELWHRMNYTGVWMPWSMVIDTTQDARWVQLGNWGDSVEITDSNLNDLGTTGFYKGHNLTNAPLGDLNYWLITSQMHSVNSAPQWGVQTATFLANNYTESPAAPIQPGDVYQRVKRNNVWESWKRLPKLSEMTAIADSVQSVIAGVQTTNSEVQAISGSVQTLETQMASLWDTALRREPSGAALGIQAGYDLNDLRATGFYRGTEMLNTPLGDSSWWWIDVRGHDTIWASQTAYSFGSHEGFGKIARNRIFHRTLTGTGWTDWSEVSTTDNVAQAVSAALSTLKVGQDLNLLVDSGFYRGALMTNTPEGSLAWFWVNVNGHDYPGFTHQTAVSFGDSGGPMNGQAVPPGPPAGTTWHRTQSVAANGDVSWTPWTKLVNESTALTRLASGAANALATGYNLDDVNGTGFYRGEALANAPFNEPGWLFVSVIRHDDIWVTQQVVTYGDKHALGGMDSNRVFVRTKGGLNGAWSAWKELGNSTVLDDWIAKSAIVLPSGDPMLYQEFPPNQVYGFDAYSSPELPYPSAFFSGIGFGYANRGFQLAQQWNHELNKPTGTYVRVKDDTQNTFGPWTRILTENDKAVSLDLDGSAVLINGVDLNTVTRTGFYRGANMGSAPLVGGYCFYVEVQSHAETWIVQRANLFGFSGDPSIQGNHRCWVRYCNGGVWGAWVEQGSKRIGLDNTFDVIQGVDVSRRAWIATLPPSSNSTTDSIEISGVIGNYQGYNRTPFKIYASNQSGLAINYAEGYMPTGCDIEFWTHSTTGATDIVMVLPAWGRSTYSVKASTQVTVNGDPNVTEFASTWVDNGWVGVWSASVNNSAISGLTRLASPNKGAAAAIYGKPHNWAPACTALELGKSLSVYTTGSESAIVHAAYVDTSGQFRATQSNVVPAAIRFYQGNTFFLNSNEVGLLDGDVWPNVTPIAYVDKVGFFRAKAFTDMNGVQGSASGNARHHFTSWRPGTDASTDLTGGNFGWITAAFGDASASRVIIGQYAGKAVLGSHNGDLTDWNTLNFKAYEYIWLGASGNALGYLTVDGVFHAGGLSIGNSYYVATNTPASTLFMRGWGIANGTLEWFPNERAFRFGTSENGNPNFYGMVKVISSGGFKVETPYELDSGGALRVDVQKDVAGRRTPILSATHGTSPLRTATVIEHHSANADGTGGTAMVFKMSGHGIDSVVMDQVHGLSVNNYITAGGPVRTGVYTMATLPAPIVLPYGIICVSDASGGPKYCWSDGSYWRILNTNTIVS